MPDLWLPGEAARAVMAEAEGTREVQRVLEFTKRLRALDSRLDCFLQTRDDPDNELRMGFYYVRRHNENGTITLWEVRTPEGAFREPDEGIIEAFRQMDRHTIGDLREQRERKRRLAERAAARKAEDANGRFRELADFTFRTQVPITAAWKKD